MKTPSSARIPLLLALPALALTLSAPAARAQSSPNVTFTTLHRFSNTDSNGITPAAALTQGNDGSFYGTTESARANINGTIVTYGGTVFKITPEGTFTSLYRFAQDASGIPSTAPRIPEGKLLLASDGKFYGTAYGGGDSSRGVVFRFSDTEPLSNFYSFPRNGPENAPAAGVIQGRDGNFYGTASGQTATDIFGTIFRLTPAGLPTTLHTFTGAADGLVPLGALVQGADGNFYGTAQSGGVNGKGTIFRITPDGVFTVIHACDGSTGANPSSALVQGSDGAFYGTTGSGGSGSGTAFRVTASGDFTVLHKFFPGQPGGGLILGRDGNFYGVTNGGPSSSAVYQLTPGGTYTTLHQFANDNDGYGLMGELVQGNDGAFYGTTLTGPNGSGVGGTVFKLTVTAPTHPAFFNGEANLGGGIFYLALPNGNPFGYYSFLTDEHYLFHQDLGYEYVTDANDGKSGVFLYDFASKGFFYTSPGFPFPYLYDFSLGTTVYYYPDPKNPGRYNTDGVRYFYRFDTGAIFSK